MYRMSNGTVSALIMAAATGLAICSESTAEGPPRSMADTRAGELPCPTVTDIQTAIGFPVKAHAVPVDGCVYEVTGRHRGAMISLMYQPATRANDIFAEIRADVKTKGDNATPDSLSLGEGGWGYRNGASQEAAVVSQGRLYHVEIGAPIFSSLKLPDDAALRVIKLGIRAAPGAHTASSGGGAGADAATRDACTLATNAEVAKVAGDEPEAVKHWMAPRTSAGGSHCDYTGGSIRVYQSSTDFESTLKNWKLDKVQRVPVSGIGDKAFFMNPEPDKETGSAGVLAVYAGRRVLQLSLVSDWNEPVAATRPRLEQFAKLVLPRIK
jgi:hypothetical protein